MKNFENSAPVIGAAESGARNVCHASSAVAWPAIIAGGVIAAAVSFGLLVLGSSLGLAVLSPWSNGHTSATAVSAGAVIWLVIMQWISSGFGGYLTGRLRTRWNYTHNDEVFFRDTAHGFLTWAVATLFTVAVLGSAISSVLGVTAQTASVVAAGEASKDQSNNPVDSYVDGLFRSTQTTTSDRDVRAETTRLILAHMGDNSFSKEDKNYLSSLIERRSGVTEAEADRRVNVLVDQINEAKATADKARKVAASLAICTFLSMLVGAFIASVAAALGGRQRDYI